MDNWDSTALYGILQFYRVTLCLDSKISPTNKRAIMPNFSSIWWEMAELRRLKYSAVLQGHCFVSRLDPLHLESNQTKIQLYDQISASS